MQDHTFKLQSPILEIQCCKYKCPGFYVKLPISNPKSLYTMPDLRNITKGTINIQSSKSNPIDALHKSNNTDQQQDMVRNTKVLSDSLKTRKSITINTFGNTWCLYPQPKSTAAPEEILCKSVHQHLRSTCPSCRLNIQQLNN